MSASKRTREMSTHCPLTKASEGAKGRQVWATPEVEGDSLLSSAPSKGCRVTVGRLWAAFTAEEKERCDKVADFHTGREETQFDQEGLQVSFRWGIRTSSLY